MENREKWVVVSLYFMLCSRTRVRVCVCLQVRACVRACGGGWVGGVGGGERQTWNLIHITHWSKRLSK